MDKEDETLHTIHSSTPVRRSQEITSPQTGKDQATVVLMLSKLAVHYYRPDFTEGQARSLIADMVVDLSEFTLGEVEAAIVAYRQQAPSPGKAKYFPDSGTLRQLASAERKHRREVQAAPVRALFPGRPLMWWMRSKRLWHPTWLENDVPEGELIRDELAGPLRAPRYQ